MNIPLRRVALVCAVMMFLLLGNVTFIQAFRAPALNADPRNQRTLIARFDHPRGKILTSDGTVIAGSRKTRNAGYTYRRTYPEGNLYAAVTGYASLYTTTGLERAEDARLSGGDPKVRLRALVRDGIAQGADVRTTIDERAQRAAYEGLAATGGRGAAVALNPATGAILALVSYPSYDPGRYTTFDSGKLARADRELRGDPGQPLLNRALNQTYPPGSTFKVVTTAAGLTSGRYTPDSQVEAPPRLLLPGTSTQLGNSGGESCGDGHPPLAYAFQASCNTAFVAMGLDLGQDVLRRQAAAFGFDGAGLRVPMPVSPSVYPSGMDQAQTAMSAIGQFDVRATPLQVAMLSAAVANDGALMAPYLVEEVRLPDGAVVERAEPSRWRAAMSAQDANDLTTMMITVTRPGGTGTAAAIPGVEVAAKTGTAENVQGAQDHALFTGFAPADDPQVAVGVVVERAGFGGDVAAPIARHIMEAVLD
ncbi:peptidoglycan D,D-transpeptidase FtsI family protein [Nonomuraea africana]|uniref:Peptidoglycan glycosyltransferase n=1 Tax=Nonomuraea africana TaxID=46171 RepID=A0ABR9KLI6_9ACTN|nr:penicillin-binding protein 2 [Nonomuraea africana]MBE1562877.1 peptidoglycan glycosyltransferase [Nonomuraea africana]